MWKKFGAALTALSVLGATVAMPAPAAADDWRYRGDGYHDGYRHDGYRRGDRHDGYYDHGYRHRDDDDDDEAIVAGVVGLALGAVIGAAVAQSNERRDDARRDYERDYAPPPPNYGYRDDYRPQERTCYRRERQWDPYANRYLWVDVPYAC